MNERVAKVARYATAMADHYLSARQKLAIMEPFVGGEIPRLLANSYGAHAYEALSLTLVLDLVRDACAFTLDKHKRAPSLVNIWRMMEAGDLRDALRARAAESVPTNRIWDSDLTEEEKADLQSKLHARDVEKRGEEFDEVYSRASTGVPRITGSELAKKFRKARNKAIAHYEMRGGEGGPEPFNLGEVGLTWGSPRQFIDELGPVLWDVVLVATWGDYDIEGYDRADRLYAADFWARLQGKPPIDHIE